MGPPIQLFLTTITSQHVVRQRQEYMLRILQAKKIPFTSYDLASDEKAKSLWRRRAPAGQQDLPGILVGSTWPGTFTQFEEAVEYDELAQFFRLNEKYDPDLDMRPPLPQQVIGVPGVALPSQTHGHKPTSTSSTSSPQSQKGKIDVKRDLPELGLDGIEVTEDEISQLMESMGLVEKAGVKSAARAEPTKPTPVAPLSAAHLAKEAAALAKDRTGLRKVSKPTADETTTVRPLNLRKSQPSPLHAESMGDAPPPDVPPSNDVTSKETGAVESSSSADVVSSVQQPPADDTKSEETNMESDSKETGNAEVLHFENVASPTHGSKKDDGETEGDT